MANRVHSRPSWPSGLALTASKRQVTVADSGSRLRHDAEVHRLTPIGDLARGEPTPVADRKPTALRIHGGRSTRANALVRATDRPVIASHDRQ